MANLFGKEMTREEILKRVGNVSQIAGVKPHRMTEGRADGVKAFDVVTGGGLEFTLLGSKCLDIFRMKYKGTNLNFVSKPGLVSPEYFNPHGAEFVRSFQAGMLYTCGLSNVGSPCCDDGVEHCLHGRIANTPAENVSVKSEWAGNEYLLEVSGQMREAALFGENLSLRRTISTSLGGRSLKIHDTVENLGFEDRALMLLYHFNLGYPMLDESSRFVAASSEVKPRDEEAAKGLNTYSAFSTPVDGFNEQVFYHEPAADKEGNSFAALINDRLSLGFYLKYNIKQLPRLIQWKSMKSGDYVVGIEPANCFVEGRAKERQRNGLKMLAPMGKASFELEIGILDGNEEIKSFVQMAESL